MTYDLQDVALPVASGKALQLGARLLETPLLSPLLVSKLVQDTNLGLPRNTRVYEAPVMAPVWPAREFGALPFDLLRAPPKEMPVSMPLRRARDFFARYQQGWSPEAVAEAVVAGMRQLEPLNAFIATNSEDLRAQAQASARRWKAGTPLSVLDGVPIAVKDEVDQHPYPTTGGSRALGQVAAASDATAVARLRALGALLIGKTNMHEIGINPNGWNAHFGQARNPYDPAHDAGGSSSGSAVAVAAGLCPIAIGCDGGGSVRVPAGFCGVVGLKATFGRISEGGVLPLCWSVGHLGPLTASVEDAALAYAAIAGPDARDRYSLGQPAPSLLAWNQGDLDGITLGVYPEWNKHADAEVDRACDTLLGKLVEAGARVREVVFPELEQLRVAHAITIISEMLTSMRAQVTDWHALAPSVRVTLSIAQALSASDYLWAQRVRARAMAQWSEVLTQVDVIITPTSATAAPRIPAQVDWSDLTTTIKAMRYAFPGNHLGLPGIAFPAGYTQAGLPISMQAMGRPWEEHVLFRVAHVAEGLVPRRLPTTVVDLLAG